MMVRYWCVVAPGPAGTVGHAYLSAMAVAGAAVRALPIGGAMVGIEHRWFELAHLFATPMTIPYVNVVCAPLRLEMGVAISARAFHDRSTLPAQLHRILGEQATPPDRERLESMVYTPKTAFAQLHTSKVCNVAIVSDDELPDHPELGALSKYDLVISPREHVAKALFELGLPAVHVEARAGTFCRLLSEQCESDITATTVASPVTAAPLATTSQPSGPPASSSRSTPSPTAGSRTSTLPKSGTAISTVSSSPGTTLRRLWSTLCSFMRRLAIWKR
jgi:hypothetical protein